MRVADIWLDTNIRAHNFINQQYWNDNFETVKRTLLNAEVYVYECNSSGYVNGFIGLNDYYIEGIFVCNSFQSKGIGKELINFAKSIKSRLSLSVYQKNIKAIEFYKREGFNIKCENIDKATGEKEYLMVWNM